MGTWKVGWMGVMMRVRLELRMGQVADCRRVRLERLVLRVVTILLLLCVGRNDWEPPVFSETRAANVILRH